MTVAGSTAPTHSMPAFHRTLQAIVREHPHLQGVNAVDSMINFRPSGSTDPLCPLTHPPVPKTFEILYLSDSPKYQP